MKLDSLEMQATLYLFTQYELQLRMLSLLNADATVFPKGLLESKGFQRRLQPTKLQIPQKEMHLYLCEENTRLFSKAHQPISTIQMFHTNIPSTLRTIIKENYL